MNERTARCGCGRLRVRVEGEPVHLAACHCDFCQKRTGSVFSVQAFFADKDVEISGETRVYNGLEIDGLASVTGFDTSYHFCPTCGSTVFWTITGQPIVGIAVGNFVDPEFPAPRTETAIGTRHRWVPPIPSAEQLEGFPTGAGSPPPADAT